MSTLELDHKSGLKKSKSSVEPSSWDRLDDDLYRRKEPEEGNDGEKKGQQEERDCIYCTSMFSVLV